MTNEANDKNQPEQKREEGKVRAAADKDFEKDAKAAEAERASDQMRDGESAGKGSSETNAGATGEAASSDQKEASSSHEKTEKRTETHVIVQDEKTEHEQIERKLQQSLLEAELKVIKLENEMRQLNEQYMKKVTEKANEAQKLVNKKLAELQEEFDIRTKEAKKYALRSGGTKLAEVLRQFDMVLTTSQKAGEAVKGYAQGFAMVFELMNKTLVELGITEIPVQPGDLFDHDTMEIFEGVDSTEFQHNQVVEVLKKGYRLHDLVIAHAIVRVAN